MSGWSQLMDGTPVDPEQLQAEQELEIFGQGIGSTVDVEVTTEDLRSCARRLRDQAERVRGTVSTIAAVTGSIAAAAHLVSSGPGLVTTGQALMAENQTRAEQIEDLAVRLEQLAETYEAAEAENEGRIWSVPRPAWMPWNPAVWQHVANALQAAWIDARMHGQVLPTRHGIGMLLEETLWAATGMDQPIGEVSRMLAAVARGFVTHEVRVREVAPPPGVSAEHPPITDLEEMTMAIHALYPDSGLVDPGTVRIDKVVADDGSISWLVLVPGTQSDIVGEHPFDWAGNPGAMLGESTGATAAVVQAIRQAGIRPGQKVLIGGHSQGGMVAMNVANQVAQDLDVTGVLTLGSPVGLLTAPTGTEVMSIEHVEDPVGGADNAANPTGENHVTIERTLHESMDPEIAAVTSWRGSHNTPTYADTASLVDASNNPAVLDYLRVVSPVLDPTATATSTYYQTERVP